MFWKLVLTLAVLLAGYLAIRRRLPGDDRRSPGPLPGLAAHLPARRASLLATALVGVMILGTGLYFYRDWAYGRTPVLVQVVNANTGLLTDYQALRRDIGERGFRTLDGRVIRLADVERMILLPKTIGPQ